MFKTNAPLKVEPLTAHHYTDRSGICQTSQMLLQILKNTPTHREVAFLCIGTDRATGDSLGPLVGTQLKQMIPRALVYGSLENPIHAVNLEQEILRIQEIHHQPFIVAVDACLGSNKNIGYIQLKPGGLKPGAALQKDLPSVGDYHITGTVNVGGFCETMVLQSTRLHLVYSMAYAIANIITAAYYRKDRESAFI